MGISPPKGMAKRISLLLFEIVEAFFRKLQNFDLVIINHKV